MRKMIFVTALLLAAGLAGCTASGQGRQTDYIGEDEAKTVALSASGVSEDQATFSRAGMETDDGKTYYEIVFQDDSGTVYEYDVDAMTGTVIAYESKQTGKTSTAAAGDDAAQAAGTQTAASGTQTAGAQTAASGTQTAIDEAGAKQIALDHAGLTADAVTFVKVERDWDDGRARYEVEFYAQNAEYDYEIDAETGEIVSMDTDAENYTPQSSGSLVSEAQVKQTVLAKVPGATEENLRMNLEHDDGRELYEGTIVYDNMKYDFEVDAYSGAVREWEAESVFD